MDSVYNGHQGQRQAAKPKRHRTKHSSERLERHTASVPPPRVNVVWSFWHVGGLSGSADSLAHLPDGINHLQYSQAKLR